MRTSTERPDRCPARLSAGSWRRAVRITLMCSSAVFDPALPLRSITDSGSPVPSGPWSANTVNR
jgi:hypothetical protein